MGLVDYKVQLTMAGSVLISSQKLTPIIQAELKLNIGESKEAKPIRFIEFFQGFKNAVQLNLIDHV